MKDEKRTKKELIDELNSLRARLAAMDVSEHRRAEEELKRIKRELQEGEERYRMLVEHSPDNVLIHDLEGRILFSNSSKVELFGAKTPDDIVGRNAMEFVHPGDLEYVKKESMEGLEEYKNGKPGIKTLEHRCLRLDGSEFYGEATGVPFIYKGELAIQVVIRDITRRKRAEEELGRARDELEAKVEERTAELTRVNAVLGESEKKYSTIFESSNDAIMLLDERGFFDCNDATLKIFGCSGRDEFLGRHPGEWSPPAQSNGRDSVEAADERIATAFREGWNFFEWTHRRKGGEDFPAEVLLTPMRLNGREVLQATVRDITGRRRAEEEKSRNYQVQRSLGAIMRSSLRPVPLTDVLEEAMDAILSVPAFSLLNKGSIFLVDDAGEKLSLVVQRGLPESLLNMCATVPFGECVCGRAASTHDVVFTDRVGKEHGYRYDGIMPHGHYCVPIIMGARVLGVINAYIPEGHKRIPEEERFLTMAADILAGIIKRKRGEENLVTAKGRLEYLLTSSPTVIYTCKAHGDYAATYISESVEKQLGYTAGPTTSTRTTENASSVTCGISSRRIFTVTSTGSCTRTEVTGGCMIS
jgi:PAS domain S-box-containing protein